MSTTFWRPAAEQATHRLVLRRRLPAPFGQVKVYVSSEGGLRYLRPTLTQADPMLLRLAEETIRPGATVWDIGANVGLFTFAAAAAAGPTGRVLAVEPDSWLVGLLRRSAADNQALAAVDILPAAVNDTVGVGRLHIARRNRSTNYLAGHGTSQAGGCRDVHLVPTVTLDWLAEHFPLPDVLKIDVEAAEVAVLAGASRVLAARPVIICEVAQANGPQVRDLLAGYRCYDARATRADRRPLAEIPADLLALPALPRQPAAPAAQGETPAAIPTTAIPPTTAASTTAPPTTPPKRGQSANQGHFGSTR